MRKIHRQLAYVLRKPPSAGAITGATRAGQVRYAMALTSSDLAVVRSTTSRPTGTISAPPAPWSTRATVSIGRLVATAQPTEARVKIATAVVKIRRAPKRSVSQPLIGMSTATVSTYEVTATFTAIGETSRLSAMCGAAGAITVPSRISMNSAPATSSASPRSTRPVSFPPRAGAGGPGSDGPAPASALPRLSAHGGKPEASASARLKPASGRRAVAMRSIRRPDRRTAFSAAPASPFPETSSWTSGTARKRTPAFPRGARRTISDADRRCVSADQRGHRGDDLVRRKQRHGNLEENDRGMKI